MGPTDSVKARIYLDLQTWEVGALKLENRIRRRRTKRDEIYLQRAALLVDAPLEDARVADNDLDANGSANTNEDRE